MINTDLAIDKIHRFNIKYCLDAIENAGSQAALGRMVGLNKQTIFGILRNNSFMPINRLRQKIEEIKRKTK